MCTGVESVVARARLRSATTGKLLITTIDTVTVGRRGFYYACPATWNSLPPHLTEMSMSLFNFRKLLKTLLFHWRMWTLSFVSSCATAAHLWRFSINLCHKSLFNNNHNNNEWPEINVPPNLIGHFRDESFRQLIALVLTPTVKTTIAYNYIIITTAKHNGCIAAMR